jgi:hypothetical protein
MKKLGVIALAFALPCGFSISAHSATIAPGFVSDYTINTFSDRPEFPLFMGGSSSAAPIQMYFSLAGQPTMQEAKFIASGLRGIAMGM